MNQSFNIVVEWPNGRKTEHTSAIGGGVTTADQLAQQFVDVNAFPGAKTVHIEENDPNTPIPKSLHEAAKLGRRMATPKPTVTAGGEKREAMLRGPGEKAYAPGRVHYDANGRRIEMTPTPGGPMTPEGEILDTPFTQPVTRETSESAGQNESGGSLPESGPEGQSLRRKRS